MTKAAAKMARTHLKNQAAQILRSEVGFVSSAEFSKLDKRKAIACANGLATPGSLDSTARDFRGAAHLVRLCSEPLLNVETEQALFRHLNFVKFCANAVRATLSESRPSRRKIEEFNKLMALANRLRNRIVRSNTRLVVSLVKKYTNDPVFFDELLSEGISCLINAVEKFDYSRGFRFSTYATRAISRDLFRCAQRRHRDQTRFVTGADNLDYSEPSSPTKTEGVWHAIDRSLDEMLHRLDDREQFIVRARFGFERTEQKPTFSYIGQLLGVSKERVRQLEGRAIEKLRKIATELRTEECAWL